jgi:hypothetical protein
MINDQLSWPKSAFALSNKELYFKAANNFLFYKSSKDGSLFEDATLTLFWVTTIPVLRLQKTSHQFTIQIYSC